MLLQPHMSRQISSATHASHAVSLKCGQLHYSPYGLSQRSNAQVPGKDCGVQSAALSVSAPAGSHTAAQQGKHLVCCARRLRHNREERIWKVQGGAAGSVGRQVERHLAGVLARGRVVPGALQRPTASAYRLRAWQALRTNSSEPTCRAEVLNADCCCHAAGGSRRPRRRCRCTVLRQPHDRRGPCGRS